MSLMFVFFFFFFFNDTATTEIYTLSLHDALPISNLVRAGTDSTYYLDEGLRLWGTSAIGAGTRSEEHTSELQSRLHLVCRLLLEKKKKTNLRCPDRRTHITCNVSLTTAVVLDSRR